MKKTIYLLCSLAFLNVAAFGQYVEVEQSSGAKGSIANVTQEGGKSARNYQYGSSGQVTITQTQSLYGANTNILYLSQGNGKLNMATLNQSGEGNYFQVEQFQEKNQATATQSGTDNYLYLEQWGGGNVGNMATITQSGSGNYINANQAQGTVSYGNHLQITQSGNDGKIYVGQSGLLGGNNAFLTQASDNSDLRVFEVGNYNTATVTQSGGAYNQAYLRLDNSGTATSIGNEANITQTGSGNVFQVEFIGDNNKIKVEQIGDNNLITDAYNSLGLGMLNGSNNTINAIQHGNNLTGYINVGGITNTTINVLSIPRS